MNDIALLWSNSKNWLIIGIVAAVVVVAVLVIALMTSGGSGGSGLTTYELAERHVNAQIDAIGEIIAEVILLPAPGFVKELGGEYIEDQIHKVIKWRYSAARVTSDWTEVIATASVQFSVDVQLTEGTITASLPFSLIVYPNDQAVRSMTPKFDDASVDFDFPVLDSVSEEVDKATEKAGEIAEQAEQKAGEIAEQAEEKAEEAKEKLDEITESLDTEDCLGSARNAGVPESVLELLDKPSDERNAIEKGAVRRALDAVGLSDVCADLVE